MKTVRTEFPRRVRVIEHTWIPLSDGCRLAAKIWLPEDAEADPVPVLLEYIPYRKGDWTSIGDATRHAYFAGHGYASVRVDLRGSGDSEGVLLDEYLSQEQDDALEVLDWLATQPWSSGHTGMFGISWGGFNSLQVAARRPPSLRAIVTVCSTDDRYADDVHYMGGCVLGCYILSWASTMLAFNARPDPAAVGERWRQMWMERLEGSPPFVDAWLSHQRRDTYWRHGSVCEDFGAIECAVYAVGGWADAYRNAILRLLEGLTCPRKGLIGPWGHQYPEDGAPGRRSAFCRRRCAGGITGSRESTQGSWTSPCCVPGCRTRSSRGRTTSRGPAAGSRRHPGLLHRRRRGRSSLTSGRLDRRFHGCGTRCRGLVRLRGACGRSGRSARRGRRVPLLHFRSPRGATRASRFP